MNIVRRNIERPQLKIHFFCIRFQASFNVTTPSHTENNSLGFKPTHHLYLAVYRVSVNDHGDV